MKDQSLNRANFYVALSVAVFSIGGFIFQQNEQTRGSIAGLRSDVAVLQTEIKNQSNRYESLERRVEKLEDRERESEKLFSRGGK